MRQGITWQHPCACRNQDAERKLYRLSSKPFSSKRINYPGIHYDYPQSSILFISHYTLTLKLINDSREVSSFETLHVLYAIGGSAIALAKAKRALQ